MNDAPVPSPAAQALVSALVVLLVLLVRSAIDGQPGTTAEDLWTALAAGVGVWIMLWAMTLVALRRWQRGQAKWPVADDFGSSRDRSSAMPRGERTASRPSRADRFDLFTDRARKVLTLAQDESQRFNHNYIGTEHLLLGLVREGDGTAAEVLDRLGVDLAKVRTAVEFIVGRGDRPVSGEIGLTPRAKHVIELAIVEGRDLGHPYVGTEHLLLGLVREGGGIAAGVLASLDVSLERTRAEVVRVLDERGSHD